MRPTGIAAPGLILRLGTLADESLSNNKLQLYERN